MSSEEALGWVGAKLDGRVIIEEVIGEGGFGIVYRGRHLGFDERVAVKCLKIPASLTERERTRFVEDMQAEARLMHRLSRMSASIVQALDVGAATSPTGRWTPYIVMELLEGRALDDEMRARRHAGLPAPTVAEAVALLEPAARALAIAHESDTAHLDIKPANLFVVELAGRQTMKILDLGIARAITRSDTLTGALTREGAALAPFTPRYGAPEQFHEQHGKTGASTDVFALALIIVELVSGAPALQGRTPLELYIASARDNPRPGLSHGTGVSEAVSAVVGRALEVDPSRRYPDAGAFWSALEAALGKAAPAQPGGIVAPPMQAMGAARPALAYDAVATRGLGDPSQREPFPRDAGPSTVPTAITTSGFNRVCTVLYVELMVPHELAGALEPEDLATLSEDGFAALKTCVEDAGGSIEDTVGDVMMAVFGLHTAGSGAAERAVHAARRMTRAVAQLNANKAAPSRPAPAVRVGVATGRVFVRASETQTRGVGIAGSPVTRAAELQRGARGGSVVVGRDTFRQVAGVFEVEPAAGGGAAGFEIVGQARGRAALDVIAGREFHGVATSFVGRAAELEALEGIIDAVTAEPSSQLVTLVGPPGVGKSRLLIELATRLDDEGFSIMAAPCSALLTPASYGLAGALLRGNFLIHEDDPRDVARDKLRRGVLMMRADASESLGAPSPGVTARARGRAGLRLGVVDSDEIVDQLMGVLGYPAYQPMSTLGAQDRSRPARERIASAFAALLACSARPVALICDDVQFADESSLDLIEELLVRLAGQQVIIACAAQPSLLERRPGWTGVAPAAAADQHAARARRHGIEVGALGRRHLEAMARDRLQRVPSLPSDLVRSLAVRSEGHPLTLVESIHLLIDVGAVDTSSSDRWIVDPTRALEPSLPTSIHGVVQARLDLLSQRARELACMAAVVGRSFWRGLFAAQQRWTTGLQAALDELCRRRIVRQAASSRFPDEQEFVFVESTAQQVAYEIFSQAARRELHGEVAQWLAQKTKGDAGAALLASHYERAGATDEAVAAWARAGEHAATLGQNVEALHDYEAACRLDDQRSVDGDWPGRVPLRVALGDVLRRMGEQEAAEERFAQARARIVRGPSDRDEGHAAALWDARIDFRLALVRHTQGSMEEARTLVERAIAGACAVGLTHELAQMYALLVTLHGRARDWSASLAAFRRGLAVMRGQQPRDERWRLAVSWLLRNLGTVAHWQARYGRAERCGLQAARYLDEQRQPDELARVLNNVAVARYMRGEYDAARRSFEHVLALAERCGNLFNTMAALANLGEVDRVRDQPETAIVQLLRALAMGEAIGAYGDLADICRNLAAALSAVASHDEALVHAGRALELARAEGGQIYLPSVVGTVVEVVEAAWASEPSSAASLARLVLTELGDDNEARSRLGELLADDEPR